MDRREFMVAAGAAGAAITAAGTAHANKAPGAKGPKPAGGPPMMFSVEEYARRYAGIRAKMAEQNIEALVITGTREWHNGDLGNLRYIGAPIDWERTYVILPLDGNPIVFNRVPAFPVFKEMSSKGPVMPPPKTPVKFDVKPVMAAKGRRFISDFGPAIAKKLKDMGLSNATIGLVCMRNLPAEIYSALTDNLPGATLVDAQPLMMEMRYYKSAEEITFMKKSGAIADAGMKAVIETAGAGVHDLDVYYAADKACAMAGGPVGGFQLLGSGPWGGKASNPLLMPGSGRVMQHGDVLLPEVGSDFQGYYTQLTVPFAIGEASDAFLKANEMGGKVHKHVETLFRPGKKVWEVDQECHEFTKDLTNGEYGTLFGIQAGEHELTFWHDNYELRPGAMAYLQPFFIPLKKPGMPFHISGDAAVVTDGEPIKLHKSNLDLVVV